MVLLSSLLWWQLGTNLPGHGPCEWLSFWRGTNKHFWFWFWFWGCPVDQFLTVFVQGKICFYGGTDRAQVSVSRHFMSWWEEFVVVFAQVVFIQGRSILFIFIWVLRSVKIISVVLSRVNRKVGRKREIPKKNHFTTYKQNLACLMRDTELGSNPQRWDDEQFRALKFSDLNHSTTGAAGGDL